MGNVNEEVRLGAEMFLRSMGMKDQQERTRMLNQLQQSQMQDAELKRMQELEKISLQQQPISKFVVPEMQGVPFGEQFITPPEAPLGAVTQPTGIYGPNLDLPIGQAPFIDLAMKLVNPPQQQGMTPYQSESLGLRQQELLSRQKEAETNRVLRQQEAEANRASRETQIVENRLLREQMHNDRMAMQRQSLELLKTRTERIPAAQAEKIGELNTILANIDKTKQLYGYATPQEHGEWVGQAKGRLGKFQAEWLGSAPPEQVKFYAYVKDMEDALLRARSGAQINEQEYKRLVGFLPDPTRPPVTFKAQLERFEEVTTTILNEKLSALETGGYSGAANFRPERQVQSPKTVIKKFFSPSTGKTKYIYSDGTEEIK